ncbi:MAG: substrate-binding domain-containing protein [Sphaerochaetaceae bacterium]
MAPSFAQGSKEKVNNVSICTPYMSSVTTKQMVDIIKSELEKANIKVSVFDSANDNSKFASDIETSVVSKVNGIIIVSIDPSLCEAQLKEAAAAGIPVFGVDSGYIEGVMQMNATSDNYQMGEAIIKYLFKLMGEKGTLVHLTYRAHPGVVKRTLALEALLPQYPNIKELSEFHVDVPNQINNAKEIVENVLTTYPQKGSVTAIMCAWDEPAIGATQALMEAGRDEVLVVGVDGNEQAVQLIKQGTNLKATMAQDFDGMAKLVAAECIKAVSGQATLKGEQYVPAILIEK